MQLPPHRRTLDGLVLLRRDLVASGVSDNQIARLVRAGVLHRLRHGAYAPGDEWSGSSPEDRHRLVCRAVLAACHESTALTHVSSVIERGVPVWGISLDTVHTTRIEPSRASRRRGDWTPHRGVLGPDDVETLDGVRVSRAARSAVEVCTIATTEASLVVVNRLLHSRAMTIEQFAEEVERCAMWPNSLTADLVLRLANPRLESVGEDRFSYLAYQQSLPKPECQVEIFAEDGRLVARLDFAWPEAGVFLEFDGRMKYERFRRPGESLEDYLMREKARENDVSQLTGWTCIRVSWADLNRPRILADRIRRVLASRSPASA